VKCSQTRVTVSKLCQVSVLTSAFFQGQEAGCRRSRFGRVERDPVDDSPCVGRGIRTWRRLVGAVHAIQGLRPLFRYQVPVQQDIGLGARNALRVFGESRQVLLCERLDVEAVLVAAVIKVMKREPQFEARVRADDTDPVVECCADCFVDVRVFVVIEDAPVFVDEFVTASAGVSLILFFRGDGVSDQGRRDTVAGVDLEDDGSVSKIEQTGEVLRLGARAFGMYTDDSPWRGWLCPA
jgi:hypothetical protein